VTRESFMNPYEGCPLAKNGIELERR